MDAQGRGRADDIDPADQWVLNPSTGEYELRLSPSAPQSAVPRPRRAAPAAAGARATTSASTRSASAGTDTREIPDTLPGPRRRRGTPEEDPLPGRRGGRGKSKAKPRKSTGKRILVWTGGTLAFVLVGVSGAAYLYYQHLNNNIQKISDDGASTGGFSKDRAINLLVIGTDKRTGAGNESYGDKESVGHADTTILLHVSKDRTNATAMSIPRDMIVDIPECPTEQEDGSTKDIQGTSNVRFNTSLGQDGRTPSCTMRTVTELTGIKPDHFMVADFNAVKTLSTAIGGVEVCLAKDIKDSKSKLDLSAGKHTIEGEEALAFLRTRYSVGLGSDLSRIELQQQFLSSMIRQMKSQDTLTDPTKVVNLAEAATKALSVDSKITDIKKLASLGQEVGKVKTKNITFTTVPVVDNTDGATVLPTPGKAEQLFSTIRDDISLTEVKKQAKEKEAAKLKGKRADASEVRVSVYNGGAQAGSAQATLSWLQNDVGVTKSSQLGNADKTLKKTTLAYDPGQADQARKLADLMGLSASALKPGKGNSETNAQGLPSMVLTLGEDFKGAGVPLKATSAADLDVEKNTADKEKCAS
ncbi:MULTISPECIES: LCP family protein [Streptomyces]|uniref:LCP family protein required for cell wall assembly n=1 Tax=Streptomyces stelliscabiei TaxID=146820 RepID=A0A8I0P3X0_9ACTN|nr:MULTISPECIES: LCP family protein [Streptomyces]KND44346.1 LytR family transcriptional regulator [Streptomyces stelliscabiei]MBE1597775.1 LCP family protein required for cell wall assembly [Streptomyces stelliscabiei]MDX2515273.1 LCP family protein [Streptomyces stelliscabiei]MDX2551904.1 LCP family protein [Streptomyces stelliscabiei]MDX2609728.1 LCP family protein [Streptomyces stelliscabiei]